MSEVVRRARDAWTSGNFPALFETFDPGVEWTTTNYVGWPEDEVYSGHRGVRRFFEEWRHSWERYEAGVDEFLDAGGDQVLVLCWQRGVGRDSQVPVEMEFAQLCILRGGLIRRMEAYSDRHAALKAAELDG